MAPYPPMPLIIGSTTPSEAATATAASKAFPPSSMISNPARVASGCAELIMPLVPTAGRTAVFRLAGPSRTSGSAVVAGAPCSGVSSALLSSGAAVVSGKACSAVVAGLPASFPAATSEAVDPVPQEQRTTANTVARMALFEIRTSSVTRLRLQAVEMLLAKLGHLRRDDDLAVRLEPVVAEVILVVVLCDVELVERLHLGHDRLAPDTLGLQIGDHPFRDAPLLIVVVEDHRPVLRPHVRALAVQSRRIMDGEVDLENIFVRDNRGIERNLHDLGVPRRLRAHCPVGRVRHVATGVPGLHLLYAPQLLVDRLQTPETAASERGYHPRRAVHPIVGRHGSHLSVRIFSTPSVYRIRYSGARRWGAFSVEHTILVGHDHPSLRRAETSS